MNTVRGGAGFGRIYGSVVSTSHLVLRRIHALPTRQSGLVVLTLFLSLASSHCPLSLKVRDVLIYVLQEQLE